MMTKRTATTRAEEPPSKASAPLRRLSPWWPAVLLALLPLLWLGGDRLVLSALLRKADSPRRAELIVVFSGGGGTRFRHAIALLRAHYANKILFVGTSAEMEFAKSVVTSERAERDGQMVFVRSNVASTFASARFIRDYVLGEHYEQVIIVSSAHHGYRMELSFSKLLHCDRFRRIYCPARIERGDEPSRSDLWLEAIKTIWYVLRY